MENMIYIVAPLVGFIGMMGGGYWGVGCGWVVVPTMMIFGVDTLSAVGIGLLQMVPSTILTVRKQFPEIGWAKKGYGWSLAVPIGAGALLTSLIGKEVNSEIVEWCGSRPIQWFLIIFIGLIAVQTISSRPVSDDGGSPSISHRKSGIAFVTGLATGLVSSMLGVGGGILIRPLLVSGFKVPEYFTSRIVRLLVLVTTATGGLTYLFRAGGIDYHVLGLSALVAAGGVFGFPLGAKMHGIVCKAGYAKHIHKSFGIVTISVPVSTILDMYGYGWLSRILMPATALVLGIYLWRFTRHAAKHPACH